MLPQASTFPARARPAAATWRAGCRMRPAGASGRSRFAQLERPLGKALLELPGLPLHLAGRIRLEHWQDCPQVAFQIDDAALVT